MTPILQLRETSRSFQKKGKTISAVHPVNLSLLPGDFVAIQGPSGSGKTTLLLLAGLMLSPDSGSVLLENLETTHLSQEAKTRFRASKIGFVFQQFHLVPYLSLLENILLPASFQNTATQTLETAKTLAESLGLSHRLEHFPSELSAGERQRTALARSLLVGPSLLLADEPTGNLDPASARIVIEKMQSFADAGGAVLLVTHDRNVAAAAKTQMAMDAGTLSPATT